MRQPLIHATLIPGDGIGPEITEAVVQILEAAGAEISWDRKDAGEGALKKYGDTLPEETLNSIKQNRIALKGPLTTPVGKGFRSVNVALRKTLDLYACVRPVKTFPAIRTRFKDVNLVVIRENTEDLYSGVEHQVAEGVVATSKVITRNACSKIAQFAFDYCRTHGHHKITVVHKANILKLTDGLFLQCCREIAENYPFIKYEETQVDNAAMQLVLDPSQFEVLLMENLYGDIISDLTSGLVGGLGVVASANLGNRYAVFESVHGSAPDIAGKGTANPMGLLLAACMMLEHIGEVNKSCRIQDAIHEVLRKGDALTRDLGGQAGTKDFTQAVMKELKLVKSAVKFKRHVT